MQGLARTTSILAEGEIMQMAQQNTLIDTNRYFDTIYRKTASLFETATQSAAIIANQPSSVITRCAELGKHLGMAFQITDDILDYTAKNNSLGKTLGDDIKEGKMTLPLIYAFESTTTQPRGNTQAIEDQSADIKLIIQIIHSTDALNAANKTFLIIFRRLSHL